LTIDQAKEEYFVQADINENCLNIAHLNSIPPSYWSISRCDGMNFKIIELDQDSSIFQSIQHYFRSGWNRDKIGVGRDGNGMTHNSFDIKKIWRVENSLLWRSYASRRHEIDYQEDQFFQNQICKDLSISNDKNEAILFHGAPCGLGDTENIIDIVIHQGFDERMSTKGMFGSGIYFAWQSSKSDCYSGRYQDSSIGETAKIILSRVCLGKFYETSSYMGSLRRPPCVNNCEGSCSHERCDSVWYDGSGRNYKECIIYDRNLCYPEFVIEYERTFEGGVEEKKG